jgi:hypothetical protein
LNTPDPHQGKFHPQVIYKGEVIPLNKYPKILAITWDTLLCFNHHINDIVARASCRLQILKALAGTTWGQCKETLLLTYKLLTQPLIDYGCAIWYPNVSETSIKKLQVIQCGSSNHHWLSHEDAHRASSHGGEGAEGQGPPGPSEF